MLVGFTAKFAGFNTPFATATYVSPFVNVTGIFTNVSFALAELPGAIPIFNSTPAGTSPKGVAVLNAKSSWNIVPLT